MNAHVSAIASTARPTSLADRAMVLTVNISAWSARRHDKGITNEVNSSHGAAADAGRYNKALLHKDAMAAIQSVVSETRTGFLERTLPWLNDGSRIIANDGYLAFATWFNGQVSKFDSAVNDFLADYPRHVADARIRLNGMFRDADYPTVAELRGKFGMAVSVMPVPDASDFRVDMSEEQAARIRADIERTVTDATTAAVRDIYARIADVTARMVERLNAYKPGKPGQRAEGTFKDSLVNNVRELVDLLPALNITGDPALSAMAQKLRPITAHDAQELRDSATVRESVKAEAEAILEHVNDFLA